MACQDRVHPSGDIRRLDVRAWFLRLCSLPGAAIRIWSSRRQFRPDVAVGISDHPRGAEVHVELRRRVEEHARGWLPAPARLPELRDRRLGMVETAPDRVGYNPLAPQQVEHAP